MVREQIPSMDAKEFYEIFMRNHDECKKKSMISLPLT